jgi:hypothetical protein
MVKEDIMIPASSTPVGGGMDFRYNANPNPLESAFMAMAAAQQGQATRAKEEKDREATLLPILAQMQMLGKGDQLQVGNLGFQQQERPTDYAALLNQQELEDIRNLRARGIDPMTQELTKAGISGISRELPYLESLNMTPDQMAGLLSTLVSGVSGGGPRPGADTVPLSPRAKSSEIVRKFGSITEDDIQATMKKRNLTRTQLLKQLGITDKDIRK